MGCLGWEKRSRHEVSPPVYRSAQICLGPLEKDPAPALRSSTFLRDGTGVNHRAGSISLQQLSLRGCLRPDRQINSWPPGESEVERGDKRKDIQSGKAAGKRETGQGDIDG